MYLNWNNLVWKICPICNLPLRVTKKMWSCTKECKFMVRKERAEELVNMNKKRAAREKQVFAIQSYETESIKRRRALKNKDNELDIT